MNYYEFIFTYLSVIPASIIHDVLSEELGEIGFESFVQAEDTLQAYIPVPTYDAVALAKKLENFPLEGVTIRHTHKLIEGRNWNTEWEKNYFKPIEIENQCFIRASFHEPKEGFLYNIVIDPKMSFGTGNHATTYLMISEILKQDLQGKEVLDMGCGTAVLAILARKKEAARVIAIDIDEWAYQNSRENIKLNQTEDIQVLLGGAEAIEGQGTFDVIFANINRNILLHDLPLYNKALKPGGILYMSGFYTEDIPVIMQKAKEVGLTFIHSTERNNWAILAVGK